MQTWILYEFSNKIIINCTRYYGTNQQHNIIVSITPSISMTKYIWKYEAVMQTLSEEARKASKVAESKQTKAAAAKEPAVFDKIDFRTPGLYVCIYVYISLYLYVYVFQTERAKRVLFERQKVTQVF